MLLNELPDANAVFPLENFAETQGFQEHFSEAVDLNTFLNKQTNLQVTSDLANDVIEETIVLPSVCEINNKTKKKSANNLSLATSANDLQVDLANVPNTAFPLFTSLDSNLCENAQVVCISCETATTLKDLETHKCCKKLPNVSAEIGNVVVRNKIVLEFILNVVFPAVPEKSCV